MCSKQGGTYFFSLSSYFSHTKNVCSKQAGAAFNLLSDFCNTKNVCLKKAGGCFLVYSSLTSIVRLMFCHEKCGMLDQYCTNFRKLEKIHFRLLSKL